MFSTKCNEFVFSAIKIVFQASNATVFRGVSVLFERNKLQSRKGLRQQKKKKKGVRDHGIGAMRVV